MRHAQLTGRLYLNEQHVGDVEIHGWQNAWGFGLFMPGPRFKTFAPLFERWASLMHSKASVDRLSEDDAAELRKAEIALYAIHAKMHVPEMQQWRQIAILNIDQQLIEWKEQWAGDSVCGWRMQSGAKEGSS